MNEQVDALMQLLYAHTKGEMWQTLVADYSVADYFRSSLDPDYAVSRRPIIRAASASWFLCRRGLGYSAGLWFCSTLWILFGLPSLCATCSRLHDEGYVREGPKDAPILLLRTGVANELRIAKWAARRHGLPVAMLSLNETPPLQLRALAKLPRLLRIHLRLSFGAYAGLARLLSSEAVPRRQFDALVPAWMALLARRAMSISWSYLWACENLSTASVQYLYFTMNCEHENAFRLAVSGAVSGYVEHGFPRRDIPPLQCRQFVYSEGYARYLRSFDPNIEVQTIGLDYFPKCRIEPTRTIVIASLQDWPQFQVQQVRDVFNKALNLARKANWRLVFRTRHYDTDAFAAVLHGPWSEVSEAEDETFDHCLDRVRPAMVWTTWSTAVLDARAKGIDAVAFVTANLDEYFFADVGAFALVVPGDGEMFDRLERHLSKERVQMFEQGPRSESEELTQASISAGLHSIPTE